MIEILPVSVRNCFSTFAESPRAWCGRTVHQIFSSDNLFFKATAVFLSVVTLAALVYFSASASANGSVEEDEKEKKGETGSGFPSPNADGAAASQIRRSSSLGSLIRAANRSASSQPLYRVHSLPVFGSSPVEEGAGLSDEDQRMKGLRLNSNYSLFSPSADSSVSSSVAASLPLSGRDSVPEEGGEKEEEKAPEDSPNLAPMNQGIDQTLPLQQIIEAEEAANELERQSEEFRRNPGLINERTEERFYALYQEFTEKEGRFSHPDLIDPAKKASKAQERFASLQSMCGVFAKLREPSLAREGVKSGDIIPQRADGNCWLYAVISGLQRLSRLPDEYIDKSELEQAALLRARVVEWMRENRNNETLRSYLYGPFEGVGGSIQEHKEKRSLILSENLQTLLTRVEQLRDLEQPLRNIEVS